MIDFLKKSKYRLLIFLAVFGPATITAISDNDAAGVATYSLSGAKFGYSILILLPVITLLLAITQEMGVRIATVTGKGLGDIIRERYGIYVSLLVFTALFMANLGTITANFAGVKATGQLFQLPVFPLIAGIVIVAFLFVVRGNYKTNQSLFLFSAFFFIVYLISAFRSQPDWGKAISSLIIPQDLHFSKEFVFASIAFLGTTITPWGQFFVHSYVIDKKLNLSHLKYSQVETFFGAFLTDFFSFFMIVATAATLFIHKIPLVSGEQAALAIKPFAGELTSLLFGLGILNAGFLGIIIIALTTAYAFSEFFGYEGSLDAPFERGKLFYGIFLFQLVVAGLITLLPQISLFKIVFYTQGLNGILLPVIFYFLLKTTNDKQMMGNHTNNRFYNYFAVISSIIIVLATIFTIAAQLL